MTNQKQKLELTWIGKDNRPRLEPRILLEDPEKSYHAAHRVTDKDIFDNRLIFGDNLLALKALEQEFAGKIKCIYIDPPYNTGNAFEHYEDGIEHSLWLSLMKPRLELLYKLLTKDGVIFINIDEVEHAYLKVMTDEIFGRDNFLGDLIWKKRKGGGNDSRFFAIDHDYILVYAKNASKEVHNQKWRVSQSEEYLKRYKEMDENGRRYYWDTLARDGLQNPIIVNIKCPDGTNITINSQKSEQTITKELTAGNIRFSKGKYGWTLHHRVYMPKGQVLRSVLDDVGTNKNAADETEALFGENLSFEYPKPESLIKKLVELCTSEKDWVLDSFAGSGTTGAVAHKMGRRWIMVELGEHCHTHIIPRMKKVIDGTDQGGVSKALNWKGGGGFRYFSLAPSLLEKDKRGNWVISKEYNAAMLASAMAKHEGFIYNPDETFYWKQGKSTEKDYIFTTTNFITIEYLDSIHEEMQPDESLLICCKSFQEACEDRYANITVRKIPNMLLGRCEFGKDDYSLNISNLPWQTDTETPAAVTVADRDSVKKSKKSPMKNQQGLFDTEEGNRNG